jgi:uncharacterized membrane protein (DUF441 family)
MRTMILLSLLINVAVLVPVSAGLLVDASWVVRGYGDPSPARGILLSIYVAILAVSAWLLLEREPMLVAPLLLVQVAYKLTTPITVGSLANPVVMSNLVVAAVHLVTLLLIRRKLAGKWGPSAVG